MVAIAGGGGIEDLCEQYQGEASVYWQAFGNSYHTSFQFPCVATKTLTVVLMPTVSHIKDQYQHLQSTGLRVTFLGTLQTDKIVLSKIAQTEYHRVGRLYK